MRCRSGTLDGIVNGPRATSRSRLQVFMDRDIAERMTQAMALQ